MSAESNSIACAKLIDLKGLSEPRATRQGKQYTVDAAKEPSVLFKDSNGNVREMRFKRNCTFTVTQEKIFYSREDVEIRPGVIK